MFFLQKSERTPEIPERDGGADKEEGWIVVGVWYLVSKFHLLVLGNKWYWICTLIHSCEMYFLGCFIFTYL